MSEKLQAERDLRARIKARLECGCLHHHCPTHGPSDVADVMLVNCIYMAEHVRHYGTAAGVTTKAQETLNLDKVRNFDPMVPAGTKFRDIQRLDIPHCGSWKELSEQIAEVWWWCHKNNANLQHGDLSSEVCTFSICLLGGVPAPDTFHADTPKGAMEKASAHLKAVGEGTNEPAAELTAVTPETDPNSRVPMGAINNWKAQIETLTKERDEARKYGEEQGSNYLKVVRWAADVIEYWAIEEEPGDDAFASIAKCIKDLMPRVSKAESERDRALKGLEETEEAHRLESEELGRFLKEHGAKDGENLIQLIVRKDRMIWNLIQALSPFYLFATVYKDRYDILTDVIVEGRQGLCIGAFQTAHETLSEVLMTCPKQQKD